MTTNSRDRRWGSRLAALVGLVGLIMAAGPATGSAATQAVAARTSFNEFRVTGVGVVDRDAETGSFVVDSRGGEHSVTLHTTANRITDHLVYRTRAPGAHTWTRTSVGSYEDDPEADHGVTAFLSTDGKRLEVLVTTCRSIVATQAPIGAANLRFPRQVSSVSCEDDDGPGPEPVGAVALPHHRAEVVYDDGTLMTGTPGGKFTKAPRIRELAQPFELLRDAATNRLSLVGYRDINGVPSLTMWSRRPAGSWGAPQPVPCPVCSARAEGTPLSFAVYKGRVAMAEQSRNGPVLIARRTSFGRWRAPVRFPHHGTTGKGLGEVTLTYNPQSGHLHAVWIAGVQPFALYTERFVRDHWTHPLRLGTADLVDSVTFTPSGRAIVGYVTFN
jgi:hypothetical protein